MNTPAPGSQSSLREANQRRLVQAVQQAGALTQAEIARRSGLSPATVSNIVHDLEAAGVLVVTTTSANGRRARSVRLSRAAGVAVGIDFGHSHLRVAVGDLGHEVLAEQAVPLDVDSAADEGLDTAARLVKELLANADATPAQMRTVAMGVPGPLHATGVLGSSSILPGWVGVHPATALRERLGIEVLVDNDANLGALGESVWGAARGRGDVAYVKVSTGVGAGLVIGGRIYHGVGGTAGELGHMTIDEQGQVCRCGNRGCLETFAAAPFLLELLRHSHGPNLDFGRMLELAKSGDTGCRRVIADAGRHIGVAVANLCNLLNPGAVVVGGDLAQVGELLLEPIRTTVRRQAIPSAADAVVIVGSELGPRAELLGALALALSTATPLLPGSQANAGA
jgi:predicted NBD/HSP70 family sugar kinase